MKHNVCRFFFVELVELFADDAVIKAIEEIRVDLKPVEKAVKGDRFSIRVDEKVRPSDRMFVWKVK